MLMVGCTSGADPSTDGSSSPASPAAAGLPSQGDSTGGPLVFLNPDDATDKSTIRLPIAKGETVSDGTLVLANTADAPIRIVDVTLQLGDGIKLLGTKVLPLRSKDDDATGVQRGFPPAKAIVDRWADAAGAAIQPSSTVPGYEVLIGLTAANGTHSISRVSVEYEAAGQRYRATFRHGLTLCVKASAASSC